MNTLKDFVNWKLTHSDKVAEVEGYPLIMENCKKNKKMKQLKIYGNSVQNGTPTPENPIEVQSVGDLVTDETNVNYGKYKIPIIQRGINLLADARQIYNGNGADDSGIANGYAEVIEDGRACVRFLSSSKTKHNKIKFKEKTQYTVSFDCKCVKINGYSSYPQYDIPLAIYYTNGGQRLITIPNDGEWRRLTFTTSSSLTISHIGTYYYDYRNYIYIDTNSFQIQQGDATEYEPYLEPIVTNVFLDESLGIEDYIDYKNKKVVRGSSEEIIQCHLTTLISKTTVIEVDTDVEPSGIYGKYIMK